MTIDDPTAIPETADAVAEYMQEADAAFEREDNEQARPLYYAATQSNAIADADASRAHHRMAMILLAEGDRDEAYRHAYKSKEPGHEDLLKAIDGSTKDEAVDPSEVPQTYEEMARYHAAAQAAMRSNDTATEEALRRAIASCPAAAPGDIALQCIRVAEIANADGRLDEAHTWADSALANSSDEDVRKRALVVLQAAGGPSPDEDPYETDGSRQLMAGLAAWEAGDQAAAKTNFEAVVAATDVTEADQGRASFYLGSIAYHDNDFDTARTHLHKARDTAVDPEKAWAVEMLEWRWQEQGS